MFRVACAALGIVIILAITLGGSILSATSRSGPQLFCQWFRHLTNWNIIFSSIWFLSLATIGVERPSAQLLGLGYFVVLMNLFVFFVRWGWFRIANVREKPSHYFGDIIVHALIPLVACASVAMVTRGDEEDWARQRTPLFVGMAVFWIVLVVWYVVNNMLRRYKIFDWPYPNGAGQTLPKDIYNDAHNDRAFWYYFFMNVMIALVLSSLMFIYVYGRTCRAEP